MKKQLLTAFFAFTPFFAAAQVSNAELLAHLQNVKTDIKKAQQELASDIQHFEEEWKDSYYCLLDMFNEIDEKLNHSLKNELFGHNYISFICDEMRTFSDMIDIIDTKIYHLSNIVVENKIITEPIFTKHYQTYCANTNNPDQDIVKIQFAHFSNPMYFYQILYAFAETHATEWLQNLQQEVDAKIIELETQL